MALFEPGRNCWRVARGDRAAVIVDACDYYRVIRKAMLEARHRILIIGWDFDPRIKLDRTEQGNRDETLGSFLFDLSEKKPHLEIKILKWDFGALMMLFRGAAMLWLARLAWQKAIKFKIDAAHPTGCTHHQKIVVIDDCFAVCGGIDMTGDRWDRPAHADEDPDRVRPNGKPYPPWHDVTMAVEGKVAKAIGELARERWKRATGEVLEPVADPGRLWPDGLEPDLRDVDLAVARTSAAYRTYPEVREIEALFIDLIAAAKRFIYAENQYFASPRIAAAIRARMMEPDPPEFVLINPVRAYDWLDQAAMDATRVRLGKIIGHSDPKNRFRIYSPVTAGGEDIYVHAKVMIVDDRVLKIGSANMNNRSLGLDSECDLALQVDDEERSRSLAAIRTRLMAEHLGVEVGEVEQAFARTGSLIATIDELKGEGKTLRLVEFGEPGGIAKFIADTELLDPKSPDLMFEGMTRKTLFSSFRSRGWRRLRRRAARA